MLPSTLERLVRERGRSFCSACPARWRLIPLPSFFLSQTQAQGEQQYPQACSLGKSSTSLDNDSSDAGSSRVVGQPRFEFGLPQVAPRPESPIGEV